MSLPNVAILGQDPLTGIKITTILSVPISLSRKKVIILYVRVYISAICEAH